MKFISKFGSKNGAGVYNALKEDARKIYKKPQIENSQKGEVKRIAAPNSAKSRPATQGDEQKFDEREKSQMESNLSGETLQTQVARAKELNLENRSQIAQNSESEKPQPLESENGVATNNENLQEITYVEDYSLESVYTNKYSSLNIEDLRRKIDEISIENTRSSLERKRDMRIISLMKSLYLIEKSDENHEGKRYIYNN